MNNPSGIDPRWMRRAINLSRRGIGRTHPNPPVGCVLVKNNTVIGEGWHHGPGLPHAEIEALRSINGDDAKGADCYVTLEPCNHTGRTPPCTEALIEAGVTRVIIAVNDPNPNVAGSGIQRLKQAGIDVVTDFLKLSALDVLEPWIKWIVTGEPFVLLKMAMSLDGHVATRTGDSRWISGEKSRAKTHKIREQLSGIMVGAGTIRCDNPSLTARNGDRVTGAPLRIIVDNQADAPTNARVFNGSLPGETVWVVPETLELKARQQVSPDVHVLPCPTRKSGLDLDAMMKMLGSRYQMESILLEGGPGLAFSMVEAGKVDKVMFFIAPMLIGGHQAPVALGGDGFKRIKDVPRLMSHTVRKIGDDVLIEGYLGDRECLLESYRK